MTGGLDSHEKPPLGLMTKAAHTEWVRACRIGDICDAMSRYATVVKPIPLEWIEELRTLVLTPYKTEE